MVARNRFRYAARTIDAGEKFEAESMKDALLLERSGHAAIDKGDEKRTYRRRDMRAEG